MGPPPPHIHNGRTIAGHHHPAEQRTRIASTIYGMIPQCSPEKTLAATYSSSRGKKTEQLG